MESTSILQFVTKENYILVQEFYSWTLTFVPLMTISSVRIVFLYVYSPTFRIWQCICCIAVLNQYS